jgi:hypothetical protein
MVDRVHEIAGLCKARAQLFGGRSRVSLLLDAATFVGEFDGEFIHDDRSGAMEIFLAILDAPIALWPTGATKPQPKTGALPQMRLTTFRR